MASMYPSPAARGLVPVPPPPVRPPASPPLAPMLPVVTPPEESAVTAPGGFSPPPGAPFGGPPAPPGPPPARGPRFGARLGHPALALAELPRLLPLLGCHRRRHRFVVQPLRLDRPQPLDLRLGGGLQLEQLLFRLFDRTLGLVQL